MSQGNEQNSFKNESYLCLFPFGILYAKMISMHIKMNFENMVIIHHRTIIYQTVYYNKNYKFKIITDFLYKFQNELPSTTTTTPTTTTISNNNNNNN